MPGKTAVWIYAPGYYRNGTGSVANIEELAAMKVKENYPVKEGEISRVFVAENNGVTETNGWRSVLLAMPPDIATLRKTMVDAGAHLWTDTPEVTAAGRGYLMVHAASDGEKVIRLPRKCDVDELYGNVTPLTSVQSFKDVFKKGETKIYRLSESPAAERKE
jgi:hypothetical protein